MLVEIAAKRRLLNDEEEGAIKVNQYLTNFFGHKFISLEAIEQESDDGDDKKKVKFQIVRDGQKAYHLSEGECSLISFCYFVSAQSTVPGASSGRKYPPGVLFCSAA
jgi:wobble nucleotide-excising tRNase